MKFINLASNIKYANEQQSIVTLQPVGTRYIVSAYPRGKVEILHTCGHWSEAVVLPLISERQLYKLYKVFGVLK